MSAHPVIVFAFALANVFSATGFLTLAFAIIRRSPQSTTLMRWMGMAFSTTSALAHLVLAASVLMDDGSTATQRASHYGFLSLHVVLAGSLWTFLFATFMARWKTPHDDGTAP